MSKLLALVVLTSFFTFIVGQSTTPKVNNGHHHRKMSQKLMCSSNISDVELARLDKAHGTKKACIAKLYPGWQDIRSQCWKGSFPNVDEPKDTSTFRSIICSKPDENNDKAKSMIKCQFDSLVKIEKETNPNADLKVVKDKIHSTCGGRSGHHRSSIGRSTKMSNSRNGRMMETSPMPGGARL